MLDKKTVDTKVAPTAETMVEMKVGMLAELKVELSDYL